MVAKHIEFIDSNALVLARATVSGWLAVAAIAQEILGGGPGNLLNQLDFSAQEGNLPCMRGNNNTRNTKNSNQVNDYMFRAPTRCVRRNDARIINVCLQAAVRGDDFFPLVRVH